MHELRLNINENQNNDLEIIVEEYDPNYHRFGIKIMVNGVFYNIGFRRAVACALPLAPVIAGNLELNHFAKYQNLLHDDLVTLLLWINTSSLADQLKHFLSRPENKHFFKPVQPSRHTIDPTGLKNMKVIETASENELVLVSYSFLVPKSDGSSARYVFDGSLFDEVLKAMLATKGKTVPPMPKIHIRSAISKILAGWKYISTIDFTSFFFQISIHSALRNFFGILVNDIFYRLKVLPMGITFAPALAQHVAEFTIKLLRMRYPNINFEAVVWIDNILILTNSIDDNLFLQNQYSNILQEFDIKAKPWEYDPGIQTLTALGLRIDLRDRTIVPSKKTLTKLSTAASALLSDPCLANFFSFSGMVTWISYLSASPLSLRHDFMSILRETSRLAASLLEDEESWFTRRENIISSSLVDDLVCFCNSVIARGDQRPPSSVLWGHTDSSTTGFAGILCDNSLVQIFDHSIRQNPISCDPLCSHRQIAVLEMLAGSLFSLLIPSHPVLSRFKYVRNGRVRYPWLWLVDNTVSKFAIIKGHSSSLLMDRVLRFWLNYGNLPAQVAWVTTLCMRADPLTRPDKFVVTDLSSLPGCSAECRHEIIDVPAWNSL